MRSFLFAALLFATPALASPPPDIDVTKPHTAADLKQWAWDYDAAVLGSLPGWQKTCSPNYASQGIIPCAVMIGYRAGASAVNAARSLLLGDCAALPNPNASDFVNIDNRLCFWRDSGATVSCPPPEPGCERLAS